MTLRRIFRRKPVKDLTTGEVLKRTLWRKVWLFIVFSVTYIVFAFLASSYTLSFAIPLGLVGCPILFYLNLFIFRRYIQIEDLEITLEEEIETTPLKVEDVIIRKARPVKS